MPAGENRERERFAAAVDYGFDAVPPGSDEDEELLRELELVALLRQSRVALGPTADESARMRDKVMAAAGLMMQSGPPPREQLTTTMPPVADAPTVHTPVSRMPLLSGVDADAPTTMAASPVAEYDADHFDSDHFDADHDDADHDDDTESNVVSIGRAGGRGRHRFPSQAPSRQHRGLLGISAAAAVMVVAVTGGGAMFSQAALPGDSLYGIKQTTESAVVGLTPGQGNKAQKQLDYASTRLDEAQQINQANTPDDQKAADISQALKGFDDQAQNGSQMWLASSNGADDSQHLNQLSGWAAQQHARLASMRTSMPAAAQPDADHSMRVLEDIRTRSQSLSNRQGCDHVASGSDELGPVPAKGACKVSAPAPAKAPVPTVSQAKTTVPSQPAEHSSSSSSEHSSSRNDDQRSDSDSSRSDSTDAPDSHVVSPLDARGGGDLLNTPQPDNSLPSTPTNQAPSKDHKGGLLGGLFDGLSGKSDNN